MVRRVTVHISIFDGHFTSHQKLVTQRQLEIYLARLNIPL